MNSVAFIDGFGDEIIKISRLNIGQIAKKHWPGAAAVGLAGVALYDIVKGATLPGELEEAIIRGEKHGKQVISKKHVEKIIKNLPKDQKLKKPVTVVTTVKEVKAMAKDPEFNWFTGPMVREFGNEVVTNANNAAVVQGKKKDYVILPKKANINVIEHEVGHLRDFSSRDYAEPGILREMTAGIWWPSYEATTMGRERRAWKYADPKNKEIEKVRDTALGTYERAFHIGRGLTLGALGAFIASVGYGDRGPSKIKAPQNPSSLLNASMARIRRIGRLRLR